MNKGVRFQAFVRNWGNCLLELVISQNRLLTNRFFKNELFQFFVGQKKKGKRSDRISIVHFCIVRYGCSLTEIDRVFRLFGGVCLLVSFFSFDLVNSFSEVIRFRKMIFCSVVVAIFVCGCNKRGVVEKRLDRILCTQFRYGHSLALELFNLEK